VKINATIIEIYGLHKFTFPLACVPWSWLWGQHRPLVVPVKRLSRCWVVILRISYHLCNCLQTARSQAGGLCNMGQAAGARLPRVNPWRRPPCWAIRGGMVQIWPHVTSAAVTQWQARLRPCMKRPHFEHFLIHGWSHCFIGDNWTCSPCWHGNLYFWTCNWKHVIKYDLYVKCPQFFSHNVQICAKFSCKNFTDVCPVFWVYAIILGGRFFTVAVCIFLLKSRIKFNLQICMHCWISTKVEGIIFWLTRYKLSKLRFDNF